MSDESSIVGRGHEILLPPQGNPFDRGQGREQAARPLPANEPQDLSPADIAARFGGVGPGGAGPVDAGDEPVDLTPDDLAARFPSYHDDRNKIPGAADDVPAPVSIPGPALHRLGKMDEGLVEPVSVEPVVEPATTVVFDDTPIVSTEAPMPGPFAEATAPAVNLAMPAMPSMAEATVAASPSEPPPTLTMAEPAALAVAEVAPIIAPPERITMPEIASAPTSEAGAPPAEAQPAPPLAETATPSTPAVGFQPYNPFAGEPKPAPQYSIAQPVAMSPDDLSGYDHLGLDEGISTQGATGAYALPPVVEDESMVERLITNERVDQLWRRIEAAEKQAVSDDSSLPHQRTANLENLKAARNLLLGGRKNYEDAQRYLVEVESDLLYANRVRRWSYSYGLLVLLYDLLWLGLLIAGVLSGRVVSERFAIAGTLLTTEFTLTIWVTILAGGLGGVTKSFLSLGTHVSKQDFDRQHMMWYITSPLMGAVMGIFVVMATQLGIFTLSGGNTAGGSAVYILYILGWLAGFQQNIALKLVERTIEVVFKPEEEKKPAAKSSQAEEGK